MAITYPTTLDAFTNPTSTSLLTSPSHAQQHSDINDAVEALEAKVAVGNTVLGTYTAFTPLFSGFTVGNATLDFQYCRVNNFVHYFGTITLGSTSAVTGALGIQVPVNINSSAMPLNVPLGQATFFDTSATAYNVGVTVGQTLNAYLRVQVLNCASTYGTYTGITSAIPFTWATGDIIFINAYYEAA